ncbi:hypothetical protein THRCLA_22174 [Thraustotheca clavata]|uniref:Transcription elongation factor Eaf N-terminal domain-containing protein n=1 Tax=Thraustotheca clavata TaxID=74557 RepID=A0A1V9ZAU7_9STRA|nr:hypothetical protein THRCLA_22174 [Thraustotheca clavata]
MSEPKNGEEYAVDLGASIVSNEQENSVQYSFRYEFQPASVDTSICALVSADATNLVTVAMAGGVQFKGKMVENKEIECILIFDPKTKRFKLEKLPWACTQLRPVRQIKPLPKRPRVSLE